MGKNYGMKSVGRLVGTVVDCSVLAAFQTLKYIMSTMTPDITITKINITTEAMLRPKESRPCCLANRKSPRCSASRAYNDIEY